MRKSRINWQSPVLILIAAGALSLLSSVARAGFPIDAHPEKERAALLSLTNCTEDPNAPEAIRSLVREGIEARGIRCVPDSMLREVLRKHRIRTADLGVDVDQARQISDDTGARDLILGSVDLWRAEEDPEVGISLRIVRVRDMRIVGASSVSARGKDFERLFGFGRIGKIEDLAPRVVQRALEQLDRFSAFDNPDRLGEGLQDPARPGGRPRIALVTLDNLSSQPRGGEIVTSILLSRLVQAGFDVLEPGVMNEIFARNQELPRGEIDYQLLHALMDATGPRLIVTGVVQDLMPATGPAGIPRFEFGARGIDGRTGLVVFTVDRGANGRDSEKILQLGRIRSMTGLVEHCLDRVVQTAAGIKERPTDESESRGTTGDDTGRVGTGWKQR